MKILLDTNFLLRLSNRTHPQFPAACAALRWVYANKHSPVMVPQVIYEFWVVATRPVENNGMGLSTQKVASDIADWLIIFPTLSDDVGILPTWLTLVTANDVKGKPAHDARLVAAMQLHGVTDIMTFNKADFARFPAIRVMSPTDMSTGISR